MTEHHTNQPSTACHILDTALVLASIYVLYCL